MTAPAPAPTAAPGLGPRTVEYAVAPDGTPLLLDLYRPAVDTAVPLVVFVHGGGWRIGSRSGFGPMYAEWEPSPFARIAASGLAVASVDYRLGTDAVFPAPLDDVVTAVAWLRDHADELGLDADRIVLWGESAGGHLAALAALTASAAAGVRAVVDWYAPSDLTAIADDAAHDDLVTDDPGAPDSRESGLLGAPAAAVPDLAAAASPVTLAHAAAPPFLILHGTADTAVPLAQSRRLALALTRCGVTAELRLLDGADHLWRADPATARAAFDSSLAFVHSHLT